MKKWGVVLIAIVLTLAATGCAHRTCYGEPHVAFDKVEQSMHLAPGTGVTAELDSYDEVQASKPGLFVRVPAGCYWLIETRHNTRFGQVRGVYLYSADDGRKVVASVTRINVDHFGP